MSEPESRRERIPDEEVPKPMTSAAVTRTKKLLPTSVTPTIARGMSRWGCSASSPSVAPPSNPAKERKPNTAPTKRDDTEAPAGRVNTDQSSVSPPGAP